jgi:hypothetical protein
MVMKLKEVFLWRTACPSTQQNELVMLCIGICCYRCFFPISGNLLFLMVVPPDLMLLHLFWHFCSDWWGLYKRETKGRCSKCMTNSSCWCKGFWIMRDGMLWVLSWTTLWDQWLGFVVGAWTKSLGLTRLCCDIMFSFAGQFELDLANAVWWMCSIALS